MNEDYFSLSLNDNKNNKLSQFQTAVLNRVIRNRIIIGAMIGFTFLTYVVLHIAVIALGETLPWWFLVIPTLGIIYSLTVIYTNTKFKVSINGLKIEIITGVPTKYNAQVPVRVALPTGGSSMYFQKVMEGIGTIELNKTSFDVMIGGLYRQIPNQQPGKFYYISTPTVWNKKKMIINYEQN